MRRRVGWTLAGGLVVLVGTTSVATPLPQGAPGRPRITITSPHKTRQPDYALTGTIKDQYAITSLSYSLNGSAEQALAVSSPFNIVFSLVPGQTQVTLTARDAAGRTGRANIDVTYIAPAESSATPSLAQLGPMGKYVQKQMQKAMKAAPSSPATMPTAAQGLSEMKNGLAAMKKALAAANVTMTSPTSGGGAGDNNHAPPPRPIDDTAPMLRITSAKVSHAMRYTLNGTATDDTGVARLTYALDGGKPRALKLKGGRFKTQLTLKHGANTVVVVAADAAGHSSSDKLRIAMTRPTSVALVDAAVKAGKISPAQGLVYKVYAAFGDPRLPGKYSGDDSHTDGDHVLDAVAIKFGKLPRRLQAKIFPYFVPPYYQGSRIGRYSVSLNEEPRAQPDIASSRAMRVMPAVLERMGRGSARRSLSYPILMEAADKTSGKGSKTKSPVVGEGSGYPPCFEDLIILGHNCHRSLDWKYIDGKNVRVWYLDNTYKIDKENVYEINDWQALKKKPLQQAKDLLQAIEKTPGGAWAKLTTLMGRKPMSDAGYTLNGGNGKLDITLNPGPPDDVPTHIGLTIPYLFPTGCHPRPVFIVLQRDMPFNTIKDDLAHEMMHSIQWTYHTRNCSTNSYPWLMEATATWAIDYVFPRDNWEHWLAHIFVHHPSVSLEARTLTGKSECGTHCYSPYLFFFYLSHAYGPKLIPAIWKATERTETSIEAVQLGLKTAGKSDLDHRFPGFARMDWGSQPEKQYDHWDPPLILHPTLRMGETVKLPVGPKGGAITIPLPLDLKHLTADYYDFQFADANIRSVGIFNGYTYKLTRKIREGAGDVGQEASQLAAADVWGMDALSSRDKKGRHMQALVKIGGNWHKDPKTGKPYSNVGPGLMFCQEPSGGRFNQVVLIASNSRMPGPGSELRPRGQPPTLFASNMGCGPWAGTVTTIRHDDDVTWVFKTKFHVVNASVPELRPMMTDAVLRSGKPVSGASYAARNAVMTGNVLGGPHFNPYFGQVIWFLTGHTTWHAKSLACGSTHGRYKNVGAMITYNFVPAGRLYRHYVLQVGPIGAVAFKSLPYKSGQPGHCSTDYSNGYADHAFAGEINRSGDQGGGKISHSDETITYKFHLSAGGGG